MNVLLNFSGALLPQQSNVCRQHLSRCSASGQLLSKNCPAPAPPRCPNAPPRDTQALATLATEFRQTQSTTVLLPLLRPESVTKQEEMETKRCSNSAGDGSANHMPAVVLRAASC